jgi:hypothetical protein
MAYTLAAAAAATGLNKTTVLRAIKSGRISGTKTETGEWLVEPAELHRVYPPVAPAAVREDGAPQLRAQMRIAEERLGEMKAALEDMRKQRDRWELQAAQWQEQAQRLAITMAPAAQRSSSVPTVTVVERRPWWRRLVG